MMDTNNYIARFLSRNPLNNPTLQLRFINQEKRLELARLLKENRKIKQKMDITYLEFLSHFTREIASIRSFIPYYDDKKCHFKSCTADIFNSLIYKCEKCGETFCHRHIAQFGFPEKKSINISLLGFHDKYATFNFLTGLCIDCYLEKEGIVTTLPKEDLFTSIFLNYQRDFKLHELKSLLTINKNQDEKISFSKNYSLEELKKNLDDANLFNTNAFYTIMENEEERLKLFQYLFALEYMQHFKELKPILEEIFTKKISKRNIEEKIKKILPLNVYKADYLNPIGIYEIMVLFSIMKLNNAEYNEFVKHKNFLELSTYKELKEKFYPREEMPLEAGESRYEEIAQYFAIMESPYPEDFTVNLLQATQNAFISPDSSKHRPTIIDREKWKDEILGRKRYTSTKMKDATKNLLRYVHCLSFITDFFQRAKVKLDLNEMEEKTFNSIWHFLENYTSNFRDLFPLRIIPSSDLSESTARDILEIITSAIKSNYSSAKNLKYHVIEEAGKSEIWIYWKDGETMIDNLEFVGGAESDHKFNFKKIAVIFSFLGNVHVRKKDDVEYIIITDDDSRSSELQKISRKYRKLFAWEEELNESLSHFLDFFKDKRPSEIVNMHPFLKAMSRIGDYDKDSYWIQYLDRMDDPPKGLYNLTSNIRGYNQDAILKHFTKKNNEDFEKNYSSSQRNQIISGIILTYCFPPIDKIFIDALFNVLLETLLNSIISSDWGARDYSHLMLEYIYFYSYINYMITKIHYNMDYRYEWEKIDRKRKMIAYPHFLYILWEELKRSYFMDDVEKDVTNPDVYLPTRENYVTKKVIWLHEILANLGMMDNILSKMFE